MKNQFLFPFLKTITFALLIFLCSNTAFSQDKARQNVSPEQRATRITDRMKSELALNPDQYKRIYQLNLDKIKAKDAGRQLDAERKANNRAERVAFQNELKSILTLEQLEKLKQIRQEKKAQKPKQRLDKM